MQNFDMLLSDANTNEMYKIFIYQHFFSNAV